MRASNEARIISRLSETKRSRSVRLSCFALLCALLLMSACREAEERAPEGAANTNAQPAAPVTTTTAVSPCDHPYYPVRAGARWQYRLTTQRADPTEQNVTRTDITENSFTERHEFTGGTTMTTGWRCGSEGLAALEYGNVSTGQATVRMETLSSEGVNIPAADRWQAGTTWNSRYEVRGGMSGAANANLGLQMSGPVEIASRIIGPESVTVPAGTYDAMKVEATITMRLTTNGGGRTAPMPPMTFRTNTWYARGVGIVKIEQAGGFGSTTTELLSFTP